jgi:hypothetical protein
MSEDRVRKPLGLDPRGRRLPAETPIVEISEDRHPSLALGGGGGSAEGYRRVIFASVVPKLDWVSSPAFQSKKGNSSFATAAESCVIADELLRERYMFEINSRWTLDCSEPQEPGALHQSFVPAECRSLFRQARDPRPVVRDLVARLDVLDCDRSARGAWLESSDGTPISCDRRFEIIDASDVLDDVVTGTIPSIDAERETGLVFTAFAPPRAMAA